MVSGPNATTTTNTATGIVACGRPSITAECYELSCRPDDFAILWIQESTLGEQFNAVVSFDNSLVHTLEPLTAASERSNLPEGQEIMAHEWYEMKEAVDRHEQNLRGQHRIRGRPVDLLGASTDIAVPPNLLGPESAFALNSTSPIAVDVARKLRKRDKVENVVVARLKAAGYEWSDDVVDSGLSKEEETLSLLDFGAVLDTATVNQDPVAFQLVSILDAVVEGAEKIAAVDPWSLLHPEQIDGAAKSITQKTVTDLVEVVTDLVMDKVACIDNPKTDVVSQLDNQLDEVVGITSAKLSCRWVALG